MMMLTQLTMQQQELLKNMDNVDTKLEEKLTLQQKTLEEKMNIHQKQRQKSIDNMDKNITKQAKQQTKALDNIDVKFKDSMRQMNERMDKIENKSIPATPPAVRSRSSPTNEARWTTPRTPSTTFEPKMVHIQGWGTFGSGVGLTQAEGRELGAMLKNKLPDEIQMLIDDILCNYMVNTRVTLRIAGGREACWKVKRALNEISKQQPATIKGNNIFALVEAPPEIRNKNRIMAIAANTCEKAANCTNSLHVRRDFRASTIYWAPNEHPDSNLIPVGRLLGATLEWKWLPEGLSTAVPCLGVAELQAATSEAFSSN